MNRDEAKEILSRELAAYRKHSYNELRSFLNWPNTKEVKGSSGKTYQLEFQVVRDDSKTDNLRVVGAIDDGGFRAFAPITEDLIITNEGKFVGEDK